MNETVSLPVIKIDDEKWIRIYFTKSIKFRADAIKKRKERVSEPNGHRFDEATAEGSIKFAPKREWDLTEFLTR